MSEAGKDNRGAICTVKECAAALMSYSYIENFLQNLASGKVRVGFKTILVDVNNSCRFAVSRGEVREDDIQALLEGIKKLPVASRRISRGLSGTMRICTDFSEKTLYITIC